MAFKKEILAALKTKHKTAPTKLLDEVANHLEKTVGEAEEAKITEVVDASDGLVASIAKFVVSDGDRRVNDALKKNGIDPAKQKGDDDDDEPEESGKGKGKKDDEEIPAYMKKFMKDQESVIAELAALKTEKVVNSRKSVLEQKLKDAPDDFKSKTLKDFKRMTFADDDDFDAFAEEVEADAKTAKQASANEGLGGLTKPLLGNRTDQGVSSTMTAYVESRKNPEKTGNDLGGKKL